MTAKEPIRIMLLDDHPVVLCGLNSCLVSETDLHIVGSFSTSKSFFSALARHLVDVVLLDYSLGPDEVDGLSLIRSLKSRFPHVRLLVMSSTHNRATVAVIMRSGADGFIGKQAPSTQLPVAIRRVAAGRCYLSDEMVEAFRENAISTDDQPLLATRKQVGERTLLSNNSTLTSREYEVLRCILDGMSVTQVAEKFSRSIKTISTQKQSAFKKLGVRSDNELYEAHYQLQKY